SMGYAMMSFQFVLIFAGILFLFLSLVPIRKLILELQEDELKQRWKILSTLILFFIVCYILFAYNLWMIKDIAHALSIVVSLMLLCGGIFCYLVGKLALRTMHDIQRLSMFQEESITDALMGIKNRRYFDQKIVEEVALSLRYKLPLSLILLDIDHFKKINDTYGHMVGDEVLRNIASLIGEAVRDTDIVARYGGEEIAIITPSCGKQEAELLAQRLRAIIEKTTMALVGATQEVIQVTVSMGVSAMNHIITDKDALIEETDDALYLAKKLGRNRVVASKW
nr:GGDEF domain-containing protein [Campylobacteraceae bacterium]